MRTVKPFRKTAKQGLLGEIRQDYWIARIRKDEAQEPQVKRAYAILEGLLNSQLKELER